MEDERDLERTPTGMGSMAGVLVVVAIGVLLVVVAVAVFGIAPL